MKTIIAMRNLTTNQKQLIAFGVLFIALMVYLISHGLIKK